MMPLLADVREQIFQEYLRDNQMGPVRMNEAMNNDPHLKHPGERL